MPTLSNYQFNLNNLLTMGGGGALPSGSTISLTEITGLDLPDPNSLVSVRSNQHGSYVTARYHKERVVTLQGRINSSAANYATDTYQLKKVFQTNVAGLPVPFYFQLPGMPQQLINVYPAGVRFGVKNTETAVGVVDFIATLIAGDPRIYSSSANVLGPQVTGTYPAANSGTANAPTIIRFDGPITNPQVTDTTTGKSLKLVTTIASGHYMLINSLDRTVLLDGVTSSYSTVDSANNAWIELSSAGTNLLSANASSIETDASAWSVSTNCSLARTTAQANVGAASLSMTSVAAGNMSATTATGVNGIPAYAGLTYTAVASLRSAVSVRTALVTINWYNAAGTFLSGSAGTGVADTTSGWTQVTSTAVAPANTAYAAVVVTVNSTGAASEVHYVDTIQLANGTTTAWTLGNANAMTYSNTSGTGTITVTWQDTWL